MKTLTVSQAFALGFDALPAVNRTRKLVGSTPTRLTKISPSLETITMADTQVLQQSESYPQYWLIQRGAALHVASKLPKGEADTDGHGDGFYSVGSLAHAENFETAADEAAEEMHYLMADLGL